MTSYGSTKILDLMRQPVRDLPWIREAVQAAIELELSTIPPYLCALWSINDGGMALSIVDQVVLDEMGHLGLTCNLLKGLGVSPQIVAAHPQYPGPLPGGVRPDLIVYLSGITKAYVHDVMMEIEKPEEPIPVTEAALAETFPSIGAFYEALAAAIVAVSPTLTTTGQLSSAFGVKPLATIDDVLAALQRIREQGEGTSTTASFNGQLAHYYAFEQIYLEKQLVENPPGTLKPSGVPIPFPPTLPMGRVPAGGWPNRDPDGKGTLQVFNDLYKSVLVDLEKAWGAEGKPALNRAIGTMTQMEEPAKTLMDVPQASGGVNYGPDFVI